MANLDSSEAFRHIWYIWSICGIYPFKRYKNLYKYYSVFVNFTITLMVPLQLIAKAFLLESFSELMRNMSTSIEVIATSLKIVVLLMYQKNLLKAHKYLKELDDRVVEDPVDRKYMHQVVRNCQRIFMVYQVIFWSTATTYAISGALAGRPILDGWLPFDWKSSRMMYVLVFVYQFINAGVVSLMNINTDVYSVVYVYVILGHIRCLAKRISSIGHDKGSTTTEENFCEMKRCVNDHRNILRYFGCLRPVISATIFIQFIVTAFLLCITTLCFFIFIDDLSFKVTSVLYLLAILIEVLPCCYMVSEIMETSTKLTTAVYSCNWMDQDLKFRKTVIIFMQHTQKPMTIDAGNMIPVSLPTFLAIIRLSFSIFTFLSSL